MGITREFCFRVDIFRLSNPFPCNIGLQCEGKMFWDLTHHVLRVAFDFIWFSFLFFRFKFGF